ncbi:hypothetical protein [Burkholderia ambifaria]|uniref:hypothetical protein n=1 Tax=Burkholderia ambifaria TaxID=152480 RepID=UPI00158DE25A|nr:hypothetical protein [Burkholderia ambifaria]
MAATSRSDAKQRLTGDWGERPETPVGVVIIDFLAENLESKYLPLGLFFEAAKSVGGNDKSAVINVVNYLTGGALPLLKLELEYIDDAVVYRLKSDEALAATTRSINPISGDFDPDLSEKLFMCYSISDTGRAVLGRDHD